MARTKVASTTGARAAKRVASASATPRAKKAAARKTAARKTAARKTAARKVVARKVVARKVVARKVVARKVVARKVVARKVVARKAAAKRATSATAPAAATPSRKSAPAGAGPLGDWVGRLRAQVAALKVHPDVELLEQRIGGPALARDLRSIERELGFDLDAAVRDLYLQANGVLIVWIRRGQRGTLPRRRHFAPRDLETMPPGAGILALAPAHQVFGKPGPVRMDYAQFMPGAPPHWGFDFPGNYYTPAFVREGDGLRVKVGDDHGAAWDGPSVTLERYLEVVLATWLNVQARGEVFVRGKGAAVKPMTLDRVLAKYTD